MIKCDYCGKGIKTKNNIHEIEISIFDSDGSGTGSPKGEYHKNCALKIVSIAEKYIRTLEEEDCSDNVYFSFECPSCGTVISSILQVGNKLTEPKRCVCGRRGGFKQITGLKNDSN